jgi:signal transduction histidine kinase/CheY-like chemotaxis protein
MPQGTGISGLAVREGRPVATADLLADPRIAMTAEFRARLARAPFRSALGLPLVVQERVLGALVVADRPGRVFGDAEVRVAQSFADQAALALERAQLYEEAQRGRREAEVIAEVARQLSAALDLGVVLQRVVDAAREVTGSDLAHIALRDEGSDIMTLRYWAGARYEGHQTFRVEPGKGVGGQVLATGRPFRSQNYASDARISKDYVTTIEAEGIVASMAVPIHIEGRVDGLLFVDNRAYRPFTDRDEAALVRLADHAGIAIRNARVLSREQSEHALLDTVLRQMPAGVVIAEAPSGRLLLGNEQVAEIWRAPFRPAEGLAQWSRPKAFHPDGRAYRPEEWPLGRSILAGEVVTGEEIEFLRGDSTRGTLRVSSAPIRNPDGRIVAGVSTFYDVTEQKRAAAEREQLLAREQAARADAEAANRAKDEFLAMLGHELRNPLFAIMNATSVLRRGEADAEHAGQLRGIIDRQAQHLSRLVDDLLDVSRLTSGKITLRRATVNLEDIAEGALAALGQAGRTGQHTVVRDLEPVAVEGDPTRLEQIVGNLLDNAFKYTPPGGRIRLAVRATETDAVVSVADTGAGIDPAILPRIFDLFVQAEGPLDRGRGGLGLGLTLVRRLVELHGGSVAAMSPGPGQGSEFVVRLPRQSGAVPVDAPGPARPAPPPCRVLLVEDNPDVRDGLRVLLETWGHRVEEAADGAGGVATALATRPDVALIDIGLPGLDGYAVARALRTVPEGRGIFLVALTGYGQPEDRRRALEAGFDAHLIKPVDAEELADVLARAAHR